MEEEGGECSKRVVSALYQALSSKDVDMVHSLLAPDLEWWFHGPPIHQHLMRLLTGSSSSFSFLPISIVAFGSTVVAEGFDVKDSSVCWVHAWSVSDRRITLLREYFNTSVTVTRFGDGDRVGGESHAKAKASSCQSLWQSKLSDESVPGLVLAL